MRLEIHVLSGGPAGIVVAGGPEPVSVGRGPESTLRFDPDHDLAVSARHALLYLEGGRWWVRDLDSRNGTFVNGRRIIAPRALDDGDRIAFGNGGPEVRIALPTAAAAAAAAANQPARILWFATGIVSVLLAVIAFLLISAERREAEWINERAALMASLDSLLAAGDRTVRSLEGERQELADALRMTQTELRQARTALERAIERGDEDQISTLRRELLNRTAELERQQLAASLDFDAIERANRRAVALVYVEDADGQVSTGTAFAVRPDAVLVTARHVLTGPANDRRPRRIGVQFSDSEQVFPARLVSTADDADVALLRVTNIIGTVPTIRGLNESVDTLVTGIPVAYIGFPLGGAPERINGRARLASPIVASGIIEALNPTRIDIQGRGAAGASGSPIFDATGRTVGLVFGGTRSDSDEAVYGVPASIISRVLSQLR